ncbi:MULTISPECIES: type II toxin-antitoxin system HicB family antitoxin [unclassified Microbispora]|uniref:type II toxin-antitoxin system HicB family antitoxin n=1 Tax=unclassified Microbispora TaxID=2614687 RepID=UPI001476348B|nr:MULTISPECIES: type II toxin-antitoxin system HicB family antitoxin [unclassified Microbispora]
MGRTVRLTATVTSGDGGLYCARCVQVEMACEGRTVDEALDRLRRALEHHFTHRPAPHPPPNPPIVVPIDVRLPD